MRKTGLLPNMSEYGETTMSLGTVGEADYANTDLPTSEPGTAQHEWTVASGNLASFTREPKSIVNIGCLYVAGYNNTGASQTVSVRMEKNGGSVTSGSGAVGAALYWTLSTFFLNVAVSDVLGLKLWNTSASNFYRNWWGYFIVPTKIKMVDDYVLVKDLYVPSVGDSLPFTGGVNPQPSIVSSRFVQTYGTAVAFWSAGKTLYYYASNPSFGFVRQSYGDAIIQNSYSLLTSAANHPYCRMSGYPLGFTWREVGIVDLIKRV